MLFFRCQAVPACSALMTIAFYRSSTPAIIRSILQQLCKFARTDRIKFGMFPSSATTCSLPTASLLPTISRISCGRYFST